MVEPVFGSLTQFYGMRKVNTTGIKQANKLMLMTGASYNLKKYLKKYLKFIEKKAKSKTQEVKASLMLFFDRIRGEKMLCTIIKIAEHS